MPEETINAKRILAVLIDKEAVGQPRGLTIPKLCDELGVEHCNSTRTAISRAVRHLRRNFNVPVLNNRDGTGYWLSWTISDWQGTLDMLLSFEQGTRRTLAALDTAQKQIQASKGEVARLLGPPGEA